MQGLDTDLHDIVQVCVQVAPQLQAIVCREEP